MAENRFSRRITFELGLGIPLLVAALVLCVLFVAMSNWRTELTFIALVLGGTAAIYSAFYVGAAAREQADRQRMSNTYELIRSVDDTELLKLREVLEQAIDHKRASPPDILAKINEDMNLRIAVRGLLNIFEDIAVAIRMGYADERLACACVRSLMSTSAIKYASFIEAERKQKGSDGIYSELQKVAGSWNAGKYHTINRDIPRDLCQKAKRRLT